MGIDRQFGKRIGLDIAKKAAIEYAASFCFGPRHSLELGKIGATLEWKERGR